jgi:hypothetical protein
MLVNKAVAKSAVCLVSLCAFHRYSFIRKTKLVNRKRKGRNEEWLVACSLMEEGVRTAEPTTEYSYCFLKYFFIF